MAAKYAQIVERLLIDMAEMLPGDRIPSEVDLASQFGVSRMTVRQALRELAGMGRTVGVRGKGTFVADPKIRKNVSIGGSFTDVLVSQDVVPSTTVVSVDVARPSNAAASALSLDSSSLVFEVVRLRRGNEVPLCLEAVCLPFARFRGLDRHDLSGSLYAVLRAHFGVRLNNTDIRLSARSATRTESALLEIPRARAVMCAVSTSYDDAGQPVEHATSIYRGDRYEFHTVNPL